MQVGELGEPFIEKVSAGISGSGGGERNRRIELYNAQAIASRDGDTTINSPRIDVNRHQALAEHTLNASPQALTFITADYNGPNLPRAASDWRHCCANTGHGSRPVRTQLRSRRVTN